MYDKDGFNDKVKYRMLRKQQRNMHACRGFLSFEELVFCNAQKEAITGDARNCFSFVPKFAFEDTPRPLSEAAVKTTCNDVKGI